MGVQYDWYEIVDNEEKLTQGDILIDIPVVIMEPSEESPYFTSKVKNIPKGIILTQACDFQKKSVTNITVCPVVPFKQVLDAMLIQNFGKAEGLTAKQLSSKSTIIEDFRKGSYLDYHLLNKATFEDNSGFNTHYQIVLLRQSYSIPKDALIKIYEKKTDKRIRLNIPYREHLARAFASLFDRIGLPIDIKINEDEL